MYALELAEDADIDAKSSKEKETENSNEMEFDDLLNDFGYLSLNLFHGQTAHALKEFIFSSQNPLDKLTPPPKA